MSGCSFMTPAKLFREIGGFDTRYSPAYFDDSDYCLEVQRRGYKVYVQPKSQIVHFGGVTYHLTAFELVAVNRASFKKKWADFLAMRCTFQGNTDSSSVNPPKTVCLAVNPATVNGVFVNACCSRLVSIGLNVKCALLGTDDTEIPGYQELPDMGIETIFPANTRSWIEENASRLSYLLVSGENNLQELPLNALENAGTVVFMIDQSQKTGSTIGNITVVKAGSAVSLSLEDVFVR